MAIQLNAFDATLTNKCMSSLLKARGKERFRRFACLSILCTHARPSWKQDRGAFRAHALLKHIKSAGSPSMSMTMLDSSCESFKGF